jgi:hypothetical protein
MSLPAPPPITIRIPPRTASELASVDMDAEDLAKRTFCAVEFRQPIIDIMERHYNAHPLIPGYSAPTPEGIREWAVKQMYQFCESNDLREVWAYLWENWYRPRRWELWARSAYPKISRLRTTMIMESQ